MSDAWQPIETAPLDGVDVLLWRGHKLPPVVAARKPEWGPGWYSVDDVERSPEGPFTAWMPLPPPPKDARDE
jgi:hypothetical protein